MQCADSLFVYVYISILVCGDPAQPPDAPCFPTLQPLLGSIHCELHVCVFERNDQPAVELSFARKYHAGGGVGSHQLPSLVPELSNDAILKMPQSSLLTRNEEHNLLDFLAHGG